MFELNKITRRNIERLTAYSSARDEFSGKQGVFLDANENPYGTLNRYPDPYQKQLKKEISKTNGIKAINTFIGNGSDEVIDLLFRIFCNPAIDKALTFSPSYGMYDVCAGINDVELLKIPLDDAFDIDFETVKTHLADRNLKLILICAPNNPTGNIPSPKTVVRIIKNFSGIVLIDEAYINFSAKKSFTDLIATYPNLIVSQTMSKAWGLAAARIGMAFGNAALIALLNKVKPPYNISVLNQNAAIKALKKSSEFLTHKAQILENKVRLYKALKKLDLVLSIYPSDTNFFLVECRDANKTYNALVEQNIIVRNRNNVLKNCIRITVGTANENQILIDALKLI